ncbi:antigen peptide transporter 2 isoform X2 [Lagenorhynchus albirostris]|uniref:antigen peptide transporter 2 isoform X2 n=1 Tax=Lagenorhynchus albirostris TaxID=27610 RepID=UPI0028EA382F|nr:antigen peptide transporter 2 isoform X2 [Lagenorhynchus albirostris]
MPGILGGRGPSTFQASFRVALDLAMRLPDLRPWAFLLLADWALLWLLQGTLGALLPRGLPGLWLEGTLRLGGLWWLLRLGGLLRFAGALLPPLCLVTPLFLSLRALVPGTLSAPPARAASAPWSWLLLGYGAAGLSWGVWAVLSPPGAREREQGQENNRALMWRLLKLSRPDLPFLGVAFFFLAVAVLGETLISYYSGLVIDILGGDFDPDAFASAIFFMCLFSVGSSLSAGCRGSTFTFIMSRINLRVRELLFSSLLCQDPAFFQETKTGELNSRLSSDTKLMSNWLPLNANVLSRSLVKVLGVYSFMLNLSPRLTLLSLLEVPLMTVAEKMYSARHQAVLQEIQDAVAKAGQVMLYLAMKVILLRRGLQQILAGDLTRGGLISFLLYQEDVGCHVETLVYTFGDMLSNVGAAEKVFCYLDRKPNLPPTGTLAPPTLQGLMEFQNVSFVYPNRPDQPVLKGLTFTLPPGKMTALVGPSGSGKSTVAALLQNLYQPTEGQVLLDGEPISQYERHYLHQQVVLVGQEPVLFSGSVRDNITYGLKGCSDEKVLAAARAARVEEFIKEMKHGLDTEVGEKGNQLAVGQKQRLAIARALVRDPRVLILDEATSALDVECEQALQDWKAHGDRTVLVIAHKLHTVLNADQILVLRQGELQEHEQLMEGQDLYSRLVQQNRRTETPEMLEPSQGHLSDPE